MTRRTHHHVFSVVALASILFVLAGCESTETGNPERMQKSLEQQKKAMGTPGGKGVPPMPTGPGMPTPGNSNPMTTGATGGSTGADK